MHGRDDDDLDLIPLNEAGEDEDSGTGLQFGDFRQDSIAPPTAAGDESAEPQGSMLAGLNLGGFIDTPGDEGGASLPETGVGMLPVDDEAVGMSSVGAAGFGSARDRRLYIAGDPGTIVPVRLGVDSGVLSGLVGPCPRCGGGYAVRDEVVVCPACHTLQHAACWRHHQGCAGAGCSLQAGGTPRPPVIGTARDELPEDFTVSASGAIQFGPMDAFDAAPKTAALLFEEEAPTVGAPIESAAGPLGPAVTPVPKKSLQAARSFAAHEASVVAAVASLDHRWVATSDASGAVQIRHPGGSGGASIAAGASGAMALAFLPGSATLACAGRDGLVRLFDTATGNPKGELPLRAKRPRAIACTPAGNWLAVGGCENSVWLFDASSLEHRGSLAGSFWTRALAFDPTAPRLAQACVSHSDVVLWDVQTGTKALILPSSGGEPTSVAFSPDGAWVVAGCADGSVRAWDAHSGRAARPARTACCRSVSFLTPDLVASGGRGGICVWHVGGDAVVPVALQSVEGDLWVVAGVSDGPFVISGGADGAVLAFDVVDS